MAYWSNLFGPTLLDGSRQISSDCLMSKGCVGIYFSAHWCPPCRGFTPQLAAIYEQLKDAGKSFEVVFVSSDQNQDGFDSYFNEMPWKALPFTDQQHKQQLSNQFGVRGIPFLVLLDSSGNIITKDGRSQVLSDPSGNWIPAAPGGGRNHSAALEADVARVQASRGFNYHDGYLPAQNDLPGFGGQNMTVAEALQICASTPGAVGVTWNGPKNPTVALPVWIKGSGCSTSVCGAGSGWHTMLPSVGRRATPAEMVTATVEVGPLWNTNHAKQVGAQYLAANPGHKWDGSWWTTVQGSMSVLQVQMPKGSSHNLNFLRQRRAPARRSGG